MLTRIVDKLCAERLFHDDTVGRDHRRVHPPSHLVVGRLIAVTSKTGGMRCARILDLVRVDNRSAMRSSTRMLRCLKRWTVRLVAASIERQHIVEPLPAMTIASLIWRLADKSVKVICAGNPSVIAARGLDSNEELNINVEHFVHYVVQITQM